MNLVATGGITITSYITHTGNYNLTAFLFTVTSYLRQKTKNL